MPRSWLKPNASAYWTSRSGPRRAPSGAKTELQECANDSAQRAAAGLAVGVLELDALDRGRGLDGIGRVRARQARLERTGERDHLEGRAGRLQARERDAREAGDLARPRPDHRHAAEAVAERLDRGGLDLRVDRRADRPRLLRLGPGEQSRAGAQLAAGARPPGGLGRRARGRRRRRARRAGTPSSRRREARSGGGSPRVPTIAAATGPSGDVRSSPSASGVPSRARMCARGGRRVVRSSPTPRSTPGNVRFSDHATAASSSSPANGSRRVERTTPNTRVATVIGTFDHAVLRPCRPARA